MDGAVGGKELGHSAEMIVAVAKRDASGLDFTCFFPKEVVGLGGF
ncbi:unknown protein [Waddlia chondrophila 2032/99]|uniref:Uncharacterized protein n=1 Tax=Waddlia chondrophila 2032/99 TaxID=765953 RepID=F8LE67_9BACT|nr:unknown protein [Waddlia chondrophila 2032/99]